MVMKKIILLVLTVSVLSVLSVCGGCEKKPNPTETPAATNAPPEMPTTNGPVHKPGSGV